MTGYFKESDLDGDGLLVEDEAYPFFEKVREHQTKSGLKIGSVTKDENSNTYHAYNSISSNTVGFSFNDFLLATRIVHNYYKSTKFLIERLNKQKEIAGRSDEVVYMKTCGLNKQDLHNRQLLEKQIEMPANHEKIEAGPCPTERKELIEKKYWESYEKHIKKELEQHEKKRIWDEVAEETRQMEIENRKALQERIEKEKEPKAPSKMSKALEMEKYYK